MRAPPPEPETIITGSLFFVADSIVRVIFSPTTEPIEPIINLESVTAMFTFFLSIMAAPDIIASLKPVEAVSCASLSL